MASSSKSPNHDLSSCNAKPLNPHASPFRKPDDDPPASSSLTSTLLPPGQFFPHQMVFRSSQHQPQHQHLHQLLPGATPLEMAATQPFHGVICYSQPPLAVASPTLFFYPQQPMPLSWTYPTGVSPTVYYDTAKQPLSVGNTVPYYVENTNKDRSLIHSMSKRSPVVVLSIPPDKAGYGGKMMKNRVNYLDDFEVMGCKENRKENWVLKKKNVGPRLRSKKTEKLGYSQGKKSWVPKNCVMVEKTGGSCSGTNSSKRSDGFLDHFNGNINCDEINLEGETSLMIKNIPNQFLRDDLISILDKHCLEENRKAKLMSDSYNSEYDFLYLPMDFRSHANCGYAFVNFTNSEGALRFIRSFHEYEWDVRINKKICEICSAVTQGKDALMNKFRNSVFPCHTNAYLPVVFSPPRDGLTRPRPMIIGRRGLKGLASAANQRKVNVEKN